MDVNNLIRTEESIVQELSSQYCVFQIVLLVNSLYTFIKTAETKNARMFLWQHELTSGTC